MKRNPLKKLGVILLALLVVWSVLNILPPKQNTENNPFVTGKENLPMLAAHRGGGSNNPENTLLAFREAVLSYGADIIESDLYLTRDGHLVYNHDAYIDRTCDVNGDISKDELKEICSDEDRRHYIADMTLEELEKYNFGYFFEDKNGERIYKDAERAAVKDLHIASVEALFDEFYTSHPDLLFIVEIKNDGEEGKKACAVLNDTLQQYPEYLDNIVVGTFHDEIEQELKLNYPHLLRGAPTGSAAKFILSQYAGLNIFDRSDFACLQIPMSYDLGLNIPLDNSGLINRAHRRGIAVQYWTINDADEMRRLIELGCDAIMTDDPELLAQVLEEYR